MEKDPTRKGLVLLAATLLAMLLAAALVLARMSFGDGVGIDAVVLAARALAGDAQLLMGAGTLLVAGTFVVVYRFIR